MPFRNLLVSFSQPNQKHPLKKENYIYVYTLTASKLSFNLQSLLVQAMQDTNLDVSVVGVSHLKTGF